MARVVVQKTWPDGQNLLIEIHVPSAFPDVVAEARQAAVTAYEAALEITLAYDLVPDDEDEDVL